MGRLEGKSVVITGAGSGIGRAASLMFTKEGAKLIAVDRTEVTIYPIRLVGAPDAMNFGNVRLLNVTHSAASFVQTDDLEAFVRAQKGLRSHATDWVDISRGLGEEEPDRELNATRALATHEMVVRAQYKAWLGYMGEAA